MDSLLVELAGIDSKIASMQKEKRQLIRQNLIHLSNLPLEKKKDEDLLSKLVNSYFLGTKKVTVNDDWIECFEVHIPSQMILREKSIKRFFSKLFPKLKCNVGLIDQDETQLVYMIVVEVE